MGAERWRDRLSDGEYSTRNGNPDGKIFFFLKDTKMELWENTFLESGPPGWNSRPATYWCVALGKLSDPSEPHFPHLEDGSITSTFQRYCQDYK